MVSSPRCTTSSPASTGSSAEWSSTRRLCQSVGPLVRQAAHTASRNGAASSVGGVGSWRLLRSCERSVVPKRSTPAAAFVVARVSLVLLTVGWALAFALSGFVDVEVAARGWSDLANLREAAVAIGALLGRRVHECRGRGHELRLRGFWYVWQGSPWAVRGAFNRGGLSLEVRQQWAHGAEDVRVDVAAVQGSVIEQLRGNVRAAVRSAGCATSRPRRRWTNDCE